MFKKTLDIIDNILTFFEDWTLFITVMVVLIALFVNVILRYIINYSLAWSEELVREVIIYTTLIGCSSAVKNRSMIKVDVLLQLVPKTKYPLMFFSHLVTIVFSLMMIIYGWQVVVQQAMTSQKTIILQVPLVILYVWMPMMGIMMLLRTIHVFYQDVTAMKQT
jgi:TRAP-type C4-dicarboxylate transport system permease small subunit